MRDNVTPHYEIPGPVLVPADLSRALACAAAILAGITSGESPAGGACPVATVVIPDGGAGHQSP